MTRSLARLSLALTALIGSVVAACGNSDSNAAPAGRPDCDEIADTCHPFDMLGPTSEIHSCHETAEDTATTNAQCQAIKAHCLTMVCVATDAGSDAAGD